MKILSFFCSATPSLRNEPHLLHRVKAISDSPDLNERLTSYICNWLTSDVQTVRYAEEIANDLQSALGEHTVGGEFSGNAWEILYDKEYTHLNHQTVPWWAGSEDGRFRTEDVVAIVRAWRDFKSKQPELNYERVVEI